MHVWPNRNETSKVKEAPVADTLPAALFTVATCTQASVHQLMNGLKMWYMCMAEYYAAMKRIKCCHDNKDGSRSCSISIERNRHMTSTSVMLDMMFSHMSQVEKQLPGEELAGERNSERLVRGHDVIERRNMVLCHIRCYENVYFLKGNYVCMFSLKNKCLRIKYTPRGI